MTVSCAYGVHGSRVGRVMSALQSSDSPILTPHRQPRRESPSSTVQHTWSRPWKRKRRPRRRALNPLRPYQSLRFSVFIAGSDSSCAHFAGPTAISSCSDAHSVARLVRLPRGRPFCLGSEAPVVCAMPSIEIGSCPIEKMFFPIFLGKMDHSRDCSAPSYLALVAATNDINRPNLQFTFNGRHVQTLQCTVFLPRIQQELDPTILQELDAWPPLIAAYVDLERISLLRWDLFRLPIERQRCRSAHSLSRLQLKKVTPRNRLQDPYVVAILIALAQVNKFRAGLREEPDLSLFTVRYRAACKFLPLI